MSLMYYIKRLFNRQDEIDRNTDSSTRHDADIEEARERMRRLKTEIELLRRHD